jgi:hypothetical protein
VISCSEGKGISTIEVDAGSLPVTHGENISDLISDSGVTRYHLQTKVWDTYSNDSVSYWHFPQGIYLEKYDSLFRVEGSVKADTAYYFEKTELWRLVGNVFIRNMKGETFETSELFWNQKAPPSSTNAIYTNKSVTIHRGDELNYARSGLKSNQSMDHYVFYSPAMEVSIDEEE